jgi:predicted transcriptional regulator
MAEDVALDTRIPAELDQKLTQLASERRKSKSKLVREALAQFVLTEEAFAAAVAEGRAAVDAGDVIDHEEVMRQIDALLAEKK